MIWTIPLPHWLECQWAVFIIPISTAGKGKNHRLLSHAGSSCSVGKFLIQPISQPVPHSIPHSVQLVIRYQLVSQLNYSVSRSVSQPESLTFTTNQERWIGQGWGGSNLFHMIANGQKLIMRQGCENNRIQASFQLVFLLVGIGEDSILGLLRANLWS